MAGGDDDKSNMTNVSRYTIADRLGVSRQSVQKHIRILEEHRLLDVDASSTARRYFWLPEALAEDLRQQRAGWEDAVAKREARRELRTKARRKNAKEREAALVQGLDEARTQARQRHVVATSEVAALTPAKQVVVATFEVAPGAASEVAPGAACRLPPVQPQRLPEETSFRTIKESSEGDGAGARASAYASPGAAPIKFSAGDRVWHPDSGGGYVLDQPSGQIIGFDGEPIVEEDGQYGTLVRFDQGNTIRVFDRLEKGREADFG
jgi:biotin operon repressor